MVRCDTIDLTPVLLPSNLVSDHLVAIFWFFNEDPVLQPLKTSEHPFLVW